MKRKNSSAVGVILALTLLLVGSHMIWHVAKHELAKHERDVIVEMRKNSINHELTRWSVVALKEQLLALENRLGDQAHTTPIFPDYRLNPEYIWAELGGANEDYRQTLQQRTESALLIILFHRSMLDPEKMLSPDEIEKLGAHPENKEEICFASAQKTRDRLLGACKKGQDLADKITWSSFSEEELKRLKEKGFIPFND